MTQVFTDSDHLEEPKEFSLLHAVSTTLSSSLNLKDTLHRIFEILDENVGLLKGILALADKHTKGSHIEMTYGLTEKELNHPSFQKWKTIAEEVLSTEQATIIPHLDKKRPIFEGHNGTRLDDESFICLPIVLGQEKIGTLSVSYRFKDDRTLFQDIKLFSLVTLMIGQEVKLKWLLESEKETLRKENLKLKDELTEKYNIHNMIGKSGAMHEVYESIKQVANSNVTVLIRGESGTGKELVAHALHYSSPRANQPFIKINCGAIPENLIESTLFGYEKGAFTDAHEQKMGRFEAADNGTVFLDEIGELSPAIQVKLLRVLQEKEFTRVGGVHPIKVNVRLVTATNKNLEQGLEDGDFRKDLYYRLNVFPIYMPALRDRRSDIMLLSEHFIEKFTKENGKTISRISSEAIDCLMSYHWPGNVRELENCIERSVLICKAETIQPAHFPPSLQKNLEIGSLDTKEGMSLQSLVSNFEKKIILDVLKQNKGNRSKTARMLHTTQRIISYKVDRLNITL